jgi:hypothetical protein
MKKAPPHAEDRSMENTIALCDRLKLKETRLAAKYHELQEELTRLVAQVESPCPPEQLVRHVLAGSIKLYDAIILAELIVRQRPKRLLEVGGFIGLSTRWLLEASRATKATVVSIDTNIRHLIFEWPADLLRRFNSTFSSRLVQRCGFFSRRISSDYAYDHEYYAPVLSRAEVEAIIASRHVPAPEVLPPVVVGSWTGAMDVRPSRIARPESHERVWEKPDDRRIRCHIVHEASTQLESLHG